jgi:all-trans-retinol dehydrogenase (NAD+)
MADSSRAALLKGGQTITEPEVVADAVVKQILSGRGAQLFIPSNTAIAAQLRGWPNWMQEFVRAGAAAMVRDTEG